MRNSTMETNLMTNKDLVEWFVQKKEKKKSIAEQLA